MGSVQPSLREHEYDPGWGVCNVAMMRQEPPVDYSEGRFDVLKRLAFARHTRCTEAAGSFTTTRSTSDQVANEEGFVTFVR